MIIIMYTPIMDVHEKHNFVVTVHTRARWVKPTHLAETILLTPKPLIGGRCERRRQNRLVLEINLVLLFQPILASATH